MLTIWGRTDSSNVQAVLWAATELGLPYERLDAGQRFGVTDTPAFIAMNPNRTVPVVKDGDSMPLWESGAILRYLASRYAPDSFWPADPLARADVDRWAEWAKLNLAIPFGEKIFVPSVVRPSGDAEAIARALEALTPRLRIADERLSSRNWMMGAAFTLADIALGSMLYRYFTLALPRPELPALQAYYARLCARPAYAAHVMVSYDALRP